MGKISEALARFGAAAEHNVIREQIKIIDRDRRLS